MFKQLITKDDYIENLKQFYLNYLLIIRNLQEHLSFLEKTIITDHETYISEMKLLDDTLHNMKEITNTDYNRFTETDVSEFIVDNDQLGIIFDITRYYYVADSFRDGTGFNEKNKFNPFLSVKKQIIDIIERRGFCDIKQLLVFLFYIDLFKNKQFDHKELLDCMNHIFIPFKNECYTNV